MPAPINSNYLSLLQAQRAQNPFSVLNAKGGGASQPTDAELGSSQAPTDVVTLGGGAPEESAAYLSVQRQFAQMSLMARFQEASARLTDSASGQEIEAKAQQLEFEFTAQMRTEELQLFAQRTSDVTEGLEGGTRTSFQQVSRQVAARFHMSVSVSSSVLNGFAGGAEALQDGQDEDMEALLAFTKDLLGKADELLNQAFETLNGFLAGEETDDFAEKMTKIMSDLQNLFAQQPALPGASEGTSAKQLQFRFEFKFEFEASSSSQQVVQESDPLTFDLDGDGIELSHFSQGADFDITGRGRTAKTAFVTGGDAFLALDRNGNGKIDSGLELFGDQHGAANGYEELSKLDANRDGKLNAADPDFARLRLFRDNGNGRTDPGELISLADGGISEIDLNYRNTNMAASGGNRIGQIGSFLRHDGSQGTVGDAWLSFLA